MAAVASDASTNAAPCRVTFVPFGPDATTAQGLREAGARQVPFPLDWTRGPVRAYANCIADGFKLFCSGLRAVPSAAGSVARNAYGLELPCAFPAADSAHDPLGDSGSYREGTLADGWQDTLPTAVRAAAMAITRFDALLDSGEPVLLVRVETPSSDRETEAGVFAVLAALRAQHPAARVGYTVLSLGANSIPAAIPLASKAPWHWRAALATAEDAFRASLQPPVAPAAPDAAAPTAAAAALPPIALTTPTYASPAPAPAPAPLPPTAPQPPLQAVALGAMFAALGRRVGALDAPPPTPQTPPPPPTPQPTPQPKPQPTPTPTPQPQPQPTPTPQPTPLSKPLELQTEAAQSAAPAAAPEAAGAADLAAAVQAEVRPARLALALIETNPLLGDALREQLDALQAGLGVLGRSRSAALFPTTEDEAVARVSPLADGWTLAELCRVKSHAFALANHMGCEQTPDSDVIVVLEDGQALHMGIARRLRYLSRQPWAESAEGLVLGWVPDASATPPVEAYPPAGDDRAVGESEIGDALFRATPEALKTRFGSVEEAQTAARAARVVGRAARCPPNLSNGSITAYALRSAVARRIVEALHGPSLADLPRRIRSLVYGSEVPPAEIMAAAPVATWDALIVALLEERAPAPNGAPEVYASEAPWAVPSPRGPPHVWRAPSALAATMRLAAERDAYAAPFFVGLPHWGSFVAAGAMMRRKLVVIAMHDVSIEANGCAQNSYTLALALRAGGLAVQLVQEQDPNRPRDTTILFGGALGDAETLTLISDSDIDFLSRVGVYVYGTRSATPSMAARLAWLGIMRVILKVGNNPMLDREAWATLGANKDWFNAVGDVVHRKQTDIIFYVPLLRGVRHTFEAICQLTAREIPHAWNDTLYRARTRQLTGSDPIPWSPTLRRTLRQGARVVLLLFEPSVSIVKTNWELLEGIEYWVTRAGGLDEIESVELFCTPSQKFNNDMLDKLVIGTATRDGKPILKRHDRIFSGKVYADRMRSTLPVVELHANLQGDTNDLNYSSYQALKYGMPWVHNSTSLRELGYYYAPNDWPAMIAAVRRAANDHSFNHERMRDEAEAYFQAHCDPASPAVWQPTLREFEGGYAQHQVARELVVST